MKSPLAKGDLEAVLRPLATARPLPVAAYHDDAVFAWERAHLLAREWAWVAREDELSSPGAWVRATAAGEDLVVVRGPDLVLRAFCNVCRHRGVPLITTPSGRCDALVCPYHGFTYDLRGRLLREGPPVSLVEVRLATWGGFVFVTLDADAAPLDRWIAPVPSHLAGVSLSLLARAYRSEHDVAANWKLCVENFQESLHFARVHPALEALTPAERATSVLEDGVWLGGVMPLRDGVETVSLDGRRDGRPLLPGASDVARVHDFHLWPASMLSVQPDYLLTYRLMPVGPSLTRVAFDILVHPETLARPHDQLEPVRAFWTRVNAEDRAICEAQQRGTASRGYDPLGYELAEEGVHAFDMRVARRHLAE